MQLPRRQIANSLFPLALAASFAAQTVELTGPLAPTQLADVGPGWVPHIGHLPDGSRVLYMADQEVDNRIELWSRDLVHGGDPVKVNGALATQDDVIHSNSATGLAFEVVPSSEWVVYTARIEGEVQLFSSRTDGSVTGTLLSSTNPPSLTPDVTWFEIAPSGTHVACQYNTAVAPRVDVSPVDGSGPVVSLPIGSTLLETDPWAFHPSGASAYTKSQDTWRRYSTAGGSGSIVSLSLPPDTGDTKYSNHTKLVVDPPGNLILYGQSEGMNCDPWGCAIRDDRLIVAAADGSSPVEIMSFADGDLVNDFAFTPDSTHVVYCRGLQVEVQPVGGGPPTILGGPGNLVTVSPQSDAVVFRYGSELFGVPIDGSTPAARLHDEPVAGGGIRSGYRITADGSRVLFMADLYVHEQFELFSAPTDGSSLAVTLNGPLPPGASIDSFELTADGSRVLIRAMINGEWVLRSLRTDGTGASVGVAGPTGGLGVLDFDIHPSGLTVAYSADRDSPGVNELFQTPVLGGGPHVKLNPPFPFSELGEVYDFAVAPNGRDVFYVADAEQDQRKQLFHVPADGSAPPTALTEVEHVTTEFELEFASDARLVFDRSTHGLFSVATDGTSAPVQLGPNNIHQHVITADGAWVFYEYSIGLWQVPTDGSTPAELVLSTPSPAWSLSLEIDEANDRLLFSTNLNGGEGEIFSAPIDGSSPPALFLTPAVGTSVNGIFAHQGQVLFTSYPSGFFNQDSLFGVGPMASFYPLSPDLGSEGILSVSIRDDAAWVLFEGGISSSHRLFAVPADGSLLPGDITPTSSHFYEDVLDFSFALGDRAVYRMDPESNAKFEIFASPLVGNTPPLRISHALGMDGSVEQMRMPSALSPLVWYLAKDDAAAPGRIHITSVDGSVAPHELPLGLDIDVNVFDFELAGSGDILFRADSPSTGVELFRAPADASRPPRRVSFALETDQAVEPGYREASGRILYRANQHSSDRIGLYSYKELRRTRSADPRDSGRREL